jgi:hypothetical protein
MYSISIDVLFHLPRNHHLASLIFPDSHPTLGG